MRIAILHNFVPPDAPPEDQDTLVQVEAISAALVRLGHEPVAVPCELDLGAMRGELLRLRPEVIFSLVESLDGADSLVYLPAAVMDMLGIRYCGCRTEALFLTTHKTLAKERMCKFGLPTPEWMEGRPIIHEGDEGDEGIHKGREGYEDTDCVKGGSGDREKAVNRQCQAAEFGRKTRRFLTFPSGFVLSVFFLGILKGVWDQGSRGLDDEAVLCNVEPGEVRPRLAERASRWGRPCFAERFIEGREFNLGLLAGPDGPESLPPAEIDFSAFPPEKPPIVGYRAKWEDDSFESRNTRVGSIFPRATRRCRSGSAS